MNAGELIVVGLLVYAGVGLAFGVAFVIAGVGRVDPGARGAGIGFRLLILPGSSALWPLLAARWLSAGRAERERHGEHG